MRRAAIGLLLSAGAWLVASPAARAAAEPSSEPTTVEASTSAHQAVSLNYFLQASYTRNFNDPGSGLNALRVFDFKDDKPRLDELEVVAQRPVAKPGDFGWRLDAAVGQTVPRVATARGLFRDPDTGEVHNYDLHQLFVSWVAPVGKGLRLDVGKFVTPFGYEVIEGYDGFNDNQTRSLLFGWAIPFTHSGLKATYPLSSQVTGSLFVVHGWDNWDDNNSRESLGLQFAYSPRPTWSLTAMAMVGPEQDAENGNDRHLYDLLSTWKPTTKLTLGLDALYGTEDGLPGPGQQASWNGVAGYVRRSLNDRFSLTVRGEVLHDGDGARTGTPQTVKEITLTPEFKIGKHQVVRADFRRDWSSEDVFQDGVTPTDHQDTATLAVIFFY